MHAHARITAGTPAEQRPRNLLERRMQQIVSHVFGLECQLTAARLEIASLQAQLEAVGAGGVGALVGAPAQPVAQWVPVSERLPEPGEAVLLDIGMQTPIRALWAAKHTVETHDDDGEWGEYNEDDDAYYCPEGWYEWNEYEECHFAVDKGAPVAWMELPLPGRVTALQPAAQAQPVAGQEDAKTALARIYEIATSTVQTRSRDIGDWYDDMERIATIAAQPATAQDARKPLTDAQIDRAIAELGLNCLAEAHTTNRAVLHALCRRAALEADRGITDAS